MTRVTGEVFWEVGVMEFGLYADRLTIREVSAELMVARRIMRPFIAVGAISAVTGARRMLHLEQTKLPMIFELALEATFPLC